MSKTVERHAKNILKKDHYYHRVIQKFNKPLNKAVEQPKESVSRKDRELQHLKALKVLYEYINALYKKHGTYRDKDKLINLTHSYNPDKGIHNIGVAVYGEEQRVDIDDRFQDKTDPMYQHLKKMGETNINTRKQKKWAHLRYNEIEGKFYKNDGNGNLEEATFEEAIDIINLCSEQLAQIPVKDIPQTEKPNETD